MADPKKDPPKFGFGRYDVDKLPADKQAMINWFVNADPADSGDAAHAIVDVRRQQAGEIES